MPVPDVCGRLHERCCSRKSVRHVGWMPAVGELTETAAPMKHTAIAWISTIGPFIPDHDSAAGKRR